MAAKAKKYAEINAERERRGEAQLTKEVRGRARAPACRRLPHSGAACRPPPTP
eukprot:SAG31_NODE_45504_length_258_cov_1.094340_1_plen_52_part_10